MLVADPYQRQGIGTELLTRLIQVARCEGIQHLTGEVLCETRPCAACVSGWGFSCALLQRIPGSSRLLWL
jgi:acetyltransferase